MEIRKPIEPDGISNAAFELCGPHFRKLVAVTADTIVFDGYFRFEPEMFADGATIPGMLYFQERIYHVEFTHKKVLDDTSKYWYDQEVGGHICLTPTELMEVGYRVLEVEPDAARFHELRHEIRQRLECLREQNWTFVSAREKREREAECARWQAQSS